MLEGIGDEDLIENARIVGGHFRAGFREIGNRHVDIGDVRGSGLFIGPEFIADRETKAPVPEVASAMINGLRKRGVLIGAAGTYGNILKIRPTLCFSKANVDSVVERRDAVLAEISPKYTASPVLHLP